MEITPKYFLSKENSINPYCKIEEWDKSVQAFDKKNYLQSLTHLFNYCNSSILDGGKWKNGLEITRHHGSSTINLSIQDDIFYIRSPFLKLEGSKRIPLLRKIAEINFHPLTLSQIVLRDDSLYFEFQSSIDQLQPNKIYSELREVAMYCDDFDDQFIQRYHAKRIQKANIKLCSQEDLDRIYGWVITYFTEALKYVEYYNKKRWYGFNWDILTHALIEVSDLPMVHGELRTQLIQKVEYLRYNKFDDLHSKIATIKKFIKKILDTPKEDLTQNFYLPKLLISTKTRSSLDIIQKNLNEASGRIHDEVKNGSPITAYYSLKYTFLCLLYDFNVADKYLIQVKHGLKDSSEQPFEKGVEILYKMYLALLSEVNEKLTEKKVGFFAKLFK